EDVQQRRDALDGDTVADLLFTSGTTGKPKGVICTHAQTLRTVGAWAAINGLGPDDRFLCVNPFFHSFGYKAGIVAWVETRCPMVQMPVLDVPEMMSRISEHRSLMLWRAPTISQSLLNQPQRDQHASSSFRLAVIGPAGVPGRFV